MIQQKVQRQKQTIIMLFNNQIKNRTSTNNPHLQGESTVMKIWALHNSLYSSCLWKNQKIVPWIKNILNTRKSLIFCCHGNKSNQNSFLICLINKWKPFGHHKNKPLELVLNFLNQPMTVHFSKHGYASQPKSKSLSLLKSSPSRNSFQRKCFWVLANQQQSYPNNHTSTVMQ